MYFRRTTKSGSNYWKVISLFSFYVFFHCCWLVPIALSLLNLLTRYKKKLLCRISHSGVFFLPRFSAFCSSQCHIPLKSSRFANLTHIVSACFQKVKACCSLFRRKEVVKISAKNVDPRLRVLIGAIIACLRAIAFPFSIKFYIHIQSCLET